MTAESVLEAVRRVEEAPLKDLVSVSVDDLETQMDHLLEPEIDSASLYRRWERQQWAVSDLDFTKDKVDWANLMPGIAKAVQNTMTLFFIGEQAVTDTLAPLLHAAPFEDERIFLATQIADEARHTVFFQRFFEEVLGIGGGLHAALDAISPRATEGFRKIFEHQLIDATELVRREPKNEKVWIEGIVTYHVIIEGYLAVTGQRTLLRMFRNVGIMPGFTAGFTAVARDESRHIGFGVLALRRRVQKNPEVARWIAKTVLELLEPAVRTAVSPDRPMAVADPRDIPSPLRVNGLELREFALSSLAKRLRSVGLSAQAVDEIYNQAMSLYEMAWAEYEKNHGAKHPVRYYQEGLVAAS